MLGTSGSPANTCERPRVLGGVDCAMVRRTALGCPVEPEVKILGEMEPPKTTKENRKHTKKAQIRILWPPAKPKQIPKEYGALAIHDFRFWEGAPNECIRPPTTRCLVIRSARSPLDWRCVFNPNIICQASSSPTSLARRLPGLWKTRCLVGASWRACDGMEPHVTRKELLQ